MEVDERATKAARRVHAAGVRLLDDLFGVTLLRRTGLWDRMVTLQHGRATPVRLRPNTPPVRDAEHQAKHRKRKAARAARKRNRCT